MEASRLLRPSPSLLLPSSGRPAHRKVWFFRRRRLHVGVFASRREEDPQGSGDGNPVDEGMPTLWKRIDGLRAADGGGSGGGGDQMLPVELSRLQREDSCMFYRSEMLEVLGLLQLQAEGDQRTKVAVGLRVTVKLQVPTSVLVVMLHLMDAAKVILNGVQQHQHK